jgi:hypothetical protein
MRYLGLLAAMVVMVCVFAYVTRLPTSTQESTNANSYAATINAVRTTVRSAGGSEQRRKWAIAQQMKTHGSADAVAYSTEGEGAETLVAVLDSMNSLLCSKIEADVGDAAAGIGFDTLSCRTTSGGLVAERNLR